MNLRTTFPVTPSDRKIDHQTPVMLIGSCFAAEIGSKLEEGKMNVMINPAGTVYNPASVGKTLLFIIRNKKFTKDDLYNYEGINLSFSHYTDFSSDTPAKALAKINLANQFAHDFLKKADTLFVTFGTARIFRFKETGTIVSNCHKLPSSAFSREILTVEGIVSDWLAILENLRSFNNKLRVIFTVSPVRHWKDGAHGNQVSKSILFVAIEELLKHPCVDNYFPAYELLMDDLRDYRFYDQDMIHPSGAAIDYIWEVFSGCYFNSETEALWKEVRGVTKAMNHRFLTDSETGKREFALNILKQISALEKRNSQLNFSKEYTYFRGLLKE